MKNSFKKHAMRILTFIFAISAAFMVATLPNQARADEAVNPAVSPIFRVNESTSVRIADDGYNGLKFTTTVNQKWMDTNAQNATSIKFGTLLYPKANYVAYTSGTIEQYAQSMKASIISYDSQYFNKSGEYKYSAAITYNKNDLLRALQASENASANAAGRQPVTVTEAMVETVLHKYYYAMEMEARSYAIIDGEIIWADTNPAYSTSVRKTANALLTSEAHRPQLSESQIVAINEYFNLGGIVDDDVIGKDGSEVFIKDGKLIGFDASASYEYVDGKNTIDVTVEDGVATLPASYANLTVGESKLLTVFDASNNAIRLNVTAVTDVITTADQFISIFSTSDGAQMVEGYYVLGNNIDFEGKMITHVGGAWTSGCFNGTLDGRGHTISNIKADGSGIIGRVGDGATVKNIAFVNVSAKNPYSATAHQGAILANAIRSGKFYLENIYVGLASTFAKPQGLVYYVGDIHVNNVVVDYSATDYVWAHDTDLNTQYGVGTFIADDHNMLANVNKQQQISNVYVIANMPLAYYKQNAFTNESGGHYSYASNETELWKDPDSTDDKETPAEYNALYKTASNAEAGDYKGVCVYEGVKRYDDLASMKADNNDYSAFTDTKYWDVIDGNLTFRNIARTDSVITADGVAVLNSHVELGIDQATEFAASYNGVAASDIVITSNSSNVSIDGSLVTVNSFDSASITVSYTFGTKKVSRNISITVSKPRETAPQAIDYDASTGEFLLAGFADETIFSATYVAADGSEIPLNKGENNLLTGIPALKATVGSSNLITIIIELEDKIVTYNNVSYWTAIISDATEFADNLDFEGTRTGAGNANVTWFIDGYYKLDSDIDFEGGHLKHWATWAITVDGVRQGYTAGANPPSGYSIEWDFDDNDKTGFAGYFDGFGHVINDINTEDENYYYNMGLFGKLYSDGTTEGKYSATVKNFAMTNVIAAGGVIAKTATTTGAVTVQDVYVHVSEFYARRKDGYQYHIASGLFDEARASIKLNNVLVDSSVYNWRDTGDLDQDDNLDEVLGGYYNAVTTAGSLFANANSMLNSTVDANFTNVYVLSKAALAYMGLGTGDWKANYAVGDSTNGYTFAQDAARGKVKVAFAANETVSNVPVITGFKGNTLTLPTATNDGKATGFQNDKNYTWGFDDISTLAPGSAGNGTFKFSGVKKYDDISAMAKDADNNSFDSFGNNWKIVNGVPVWKSLVNSIETTIFVNGDVTDNAFEIGKESSATITASAFGDDSLVTLESSNSNVLDVNGNVVTAVNQGTAELTVNVHVTDDTIVSRTLNVTVTKAVRTITVAVDYDGTTKELLTDVYDGENVLNTYYVNGDVKSNLADLALEYRVGVSNNISVQVETDEYLYNFTNVYWWTYLISDLAEFRATVEFDGTANWINDGFYKMTTDVDLEGVKLVQNWTLKDGTTGTKASATAAISTWVTNATNNGFAGYFDGNGHVIDNFDVDTANETYNMGLFGKFYSTGTSDGSYTALVKNFALTNVLARQGDPVLAMCTDLDGKIYIDNVFIDIKKMNYAYFMGGIVKEPTASLQMNAVVFEFEEYNNTNTGDYFKHNTDSWYAQNMPTSSKLGMWPHYTNNGGALMQNISNFKTAATDSNFTNVYVLTDLALGFQGAGMGDLKAKYATAVKDGETITGYTFNPAGDSSYTYLYGANATRGKNPVVQGMTDTLKAAGATDTEFKDYNNWIWGVKDMSDIAAGTAGAGYVKLSGVKQYSNASQMAADKANNDDFSAFNSNWMIVNGVPVWKSLSNNVSLTVKVDGNVATNGQSFNLEIDDSIEITTEVFSASANAIITTNSDAVSVSENVITAVKPGDATITVSVDGIVSTINVVVPMPEINYNVGDSISIGKDGTFAVSYNVAGGAELTDATLSLVNAQSTILSVSENVITALEIGTEQVEISITVYGVTVTKIITVTVTKPVRQLTNPVDFDASTNTFLAEGFANIEIDSVKAIVAGVEHPLNKAENNVLTGMPSLKATVGTSNVITIVVETAEEFLQYTNVNYWTVVISNSEELRAVLDFRGTRTASGNAGVTWFVDGFYRMDSDVDLDDIPFDNWATYLVNGEYVASQTAVSGGSIQWDYDADKRTGFAGYFDGFGHIIDNFNSDNYNTTYKLGLFGKFYSDGTANGNYTPVAKNFAMTNVSALGGILGKEASTKGKITIENVYVHLDKFVKARSNNYQYRIASGLIENPNPTLKMNNILVDEQIYDWADSGDIDGDGNITEILGGYGYVSSAGGALFGASKSLMTAEGDANLTNIFVLSQVSLTYSGNAASEWKLAFAKGDNVNGYTFTDNPRQFTNAKGNQAYIYAGYASNETVANVPFVTGFKGDTLTLPGATDAQFKDYKNYTWGCDNIAGLATGVYTNGMFRFSGIKKYNTINDMASDATNNDLTSFKNSNWQVVNGVPVWRSLVSNVQLTVSVNGVAADTATIERGDSATVSAVAFGNEGDVVLSCDSDVVSISNGNVITANKVGSAIVKVSVDGAESYVTITVPVPQTSYNVADSFNVNIGESKAITYTLAGLGTFEDAQLTVIEGDSVTTDGNSIFADKFGTSTVKLTFVVDGYTVEKTFEVTVTKATYELDTPIDYDASTGEFTIEGIKDWSINSAEVTINKVDKFAKVYSTANDTLVKGENNTYTGLPVLWATHLNDNLLRVTFETDDAIYVYTNVRYWNIIITDADELVKTFIDPAVEGVTTQYALSYYTMDNNVDMKAYDENTLKYSAVGFMGYFDGRGHVIDNFNGLSITGEKTADAKGLFTRFHIGYVAGAVGSTYDEVGWGTVQPVVKNFALNNVKASGSILGSMSQHATFMVTLEDIYVDIDTAYFFNGTMYKQVLRPFQGLINTPYQNLKMNNVYLEFTEFTRNAIGEYGYTKDDNLGYNDVGAIMNFSSTDAILFGDAHYLMTSATDAQLTNVYAVSHKALTYNQPGTGQWYNTFVKQVTDEAGNISHAFSGKTGGKILNYYYNVGYGANETQGNVLIPSDIKAGLKAYNGALTSKLAGYVCKTCREVYVGSEVTICPTCSAAMTTSADLYKESYSYKWNFHDLSNIAPGTGGVDGSGNAITNVVDGTTGIWKFSGVYRYRTLDELKKANNSFDSFRSNSSWVINDDGTLGWAKLAN